MGLSTRCESDERSQSNANNMMATTEVHVGARTPVSFLPALQKFAASKTGNLCERWEEWVNCFFLLMYNTTIQQKFTSWIVCLKSSGRPAADSTKTAEFTTGQRSDTQVTGGVYARLQNKCGEKCTITFEIKLCSSKKNQWNKGILCVKDYTLLTFDSVHLGVMLSDVHYGVIVANVGQRWRGSTDHPPLGALLMLMEK